MIEADLQQYYQIPLSWLFAGRLTWRRLGVLIRQLPVNSRLGREINGEAADWTITDHLLAHNIDAVNIGNWQRQGDKKIKPPKPFPRPGSKGRPNKKSRLSDAERAARLRRLKSMQPPKEGTS